MTDDYPYMSYYLSPDSMEREAVVVSHDGYKWTTTAGRFMASQHATYYNDKPDELGLLTQWKSYVLPLHHNLGLDSIPQLIDELSGGKKSALQEGWEEVKDEVIEKSTAVLNGEPFYSQLSQTGIDMSLLQARGTDVDTLYVYIQSQVLQQTVMEGSTPYIPLSVMLAIASQYERSSAVFTGMEALVYNYLAEPEKYSVREDAVYLSSKKYIDRHETQSLLSKAVELLPDLQGENREGKCVICDTFTPLIRIPNTDTTRSIYVISREVTSEDQVPISLHNAIIKKGFYYRGTMSYVLNQMNELRYPIWFYDTEEVGSVFPPLLSAKPNVEVEQHSKSIEWNDEIPSVSIRITKKGSYSTLDSTEDYLGTERYYPTSAPSVSLPIPREGDECVFFRVLVPAKVPGNKVSVLIPRQEVYQLIDIGDELRDYTSLTIYTGSFSQSEKLNATDMGHGWYLYDKYLFSTTASSVPVQVWNAIRSIQNKIKPNELIRFAREEEKTLPLSLGSLWRHWTSIRWVSRSTDRETRWILDGGSVSGSYKGTPVGLYVGTNNMAEKFLLSRNRFGILQAFHRPIGSSAAIMVGLPLPSVGVPVGSYIDTDRDRWYFSDSSHIIVDVADNNIMTTIGDERQVFIPPLRDVLSFSQPDGKYVATLIRTASDIKWNFQREARAEDRVASYSDLLNYYSSVYYKVQEKDWLHPPSRSVQHIYPAEGETALLTTEEAKTIVSHGRTLIIVKRGDNRGLAEAIARQTLASPTHNILAVYAGDSNMETILADSPVITWKTATSTVPETSIVSYSVPWPVERTTVEVTNSKHELIASHLEGGTIMKWYRSVEGFKDVVLISHPRLPSSIKIRQGSVVLSTVTEEQAEEAVTILQEENDGTGLVEMPTLLGAPTTENKKKLKQFILSNTLN